MKQIQVCFSTDQFRNYPNKYSTVVIVDLLRATSVISTGLEYGLKSIIPVSNIEEALIYEKEPNHIIAAERNTFIVDGFNYGNSPYHYMTSDIRNKKLVLTTTNGTKAIKLAKNSEKVITASFLNIDAVFDYLKEDVNDVIIFCSGWKGEFNLEDSIFAGALTEKLLRTNKFSSECDSLYASLSLYSIAKDNLFDFLKVSAYRKRNSSPEVIRDTHFCLNPTISSNIVPMLVDGELVKMTR